MKFVNKFYILLIFINQTINAQISLKGIVCDSTSNETLPFATIKLFTEHTDSLLIATITDTLGNFTLPKLTKDKYKIQCTYVGYKKWSSIIDLKAFNKKEFYIKIAMVPDVNIINSIEVKGQRKYSEYFNKNIYRPDSIVIKNSINALDVLKTISQVEVNQISNQVSILGKSNTLVLINNIPVSKTISLSAIKPEEIERIEIINTPSSKYESEYSSVINVVLKNEAKDGVKINSSAGLFYNFGMFDFTVSYGKSNYRFFTSTTNQIRYYYYDICNKRKDSLNKLVYQSEEKNSFYKKNDHSITLGADFYLKKNNSLNIIYKLNYLNYNNTSRQNIYLPITNNNKQQIYYSNYMGQQLMHNFSIYHRKLYNSTGNTIETYFNYYNMNSLDNTRIDIEMENNNRNEKEKDLKSSYSFQTNYNFYINDALSSEIGYNFKYSTINNKFNVTTSTMYYLFSYNELNNAVFIDIYIDYEKSNFWGGFKYENSYIVLDDTIHLKRNNYLPYLGLSVNINNKNSISVSYDNFINKPTIWQLNPFVYFNDSTTFSSGNPNLLPEVVNNIELKYSYNKTDKIQLSNILYYEWCSNLIDNITEILPNGRWINTYLNVTKNNKYGIKLYISKSIHKKLSISSFIDCFFANFYQDQKTNSGMGYNTKFDINYDITNKMFLGIYSFVPFYKNIVSQGYLNNKIFMNQVYIGFNLFNNTSKLYLLCFNLPNSHNITYTNLNNFKQEKTLITKSFTFGIYFSWKLQKGKLLKNIKNNYNFENDAKSKF